MKQNTQNRTCITIRIHKHNNKNVYVHTKLLHNEELLYCVPTRCFLDDQNEEERCVGYMTQGGKKRKACRLFMGRRGGKTWL